MKRVFQFGKVDYEETGSRKNLVTVTMEYKEDGDKKCLSICGDIWNARHSDIVAGGQCLDTIAEYIKTPLFRELHRLWKLYHLNDMHPECEHQHAAGWADKAGEKVNIYEYTLTIEAIRAQDKIKKAVLEAAVKGEPVELPAADRLLLALNYSHKTHAETLPAEIANFCKLKNTEVKTLGWLRESEHPQGLLCRPCPVCGYKYGSAWKYFPIPAEDEQIIYKLLNEGSL